MTRRVVPEHLPQFRYPADPWKFVEVGFSREDLPLTETLFAVGNGYLGLRGDHEEGRDANDPGTFINGFHETWSIHHAEQAFGFATTGQTIVNVPDPKVMSLYVDDEPLELSFADLASLRARARPSPRHGQPRPHLADGGRQARARALGAARVARPPPHRGDHLRGHDGARRGTDRHRLPPAQPPGRRVRAAAGDVHRVGRGGQPRARPAPAPHVQPPRAPAAHPHRRRPADGRSATSARTARCRSPARRVTRSSRRRCSTSTSRSAPTRRPRSWPASWPSRPVAEGHQVRQLPHVALRAAASTPEVVDDAFELATRCTRSLDRVEHDGYEALVSAQEAWLDEFWANSDVEMRHRRGDDGSAGRRWPRWPTSRRCAGTCSSSPRRRRRSASRASPPRASPAAATRATTSGTPRCTWRRSSSYTRPEAARQLLRFRWRMLPIARQPGRRPQPGRCAVPVADDQRRGGVGVLRRRHRAVPHQRRHRLRPQTLRRRQRRHRLPRQGRRRDPRRDRSAVERPRVLLDHATANGNGNGNGNGDGEPLFHIHGVTGPDEYTAVVNDNLYTNVMARFNLRYAAAGARAARASRRRTPTPRSPAASTSATTRRRGVGRAPPSAMYLPYDAELGIHPQDADFLDLQPWDFEHTPADKYPLLLHFHPLVIYRHQVLKQADVVLAMSLRNDQFSTEVRRRNFEYYDPITTGDSSLSACVQATAAAQIGFGDLAVRLLPRGAVRRPRRPPRQHPRRRARRVVPAACGGPSCSGSPGCSRPARRSASIRKLPDAVRADVVPGPAPRLAHARRARSRRLHRHRRRRAIRFRSTRQPGGPG